ncbi:SHOCT domain-containing protein [Rhodobacterales bacterium HKCCE2091]|nr:SHOCT domain-containing protein [Rhodobacterales bacterium HKCCE2091]
MSMLTSHGAAVESDLSQRYGVSPDAVRTLMGAIVRGGGTQAQFSHPELGGMGQWSQGGMTMVGDMFNTGLQNLVNNLCTEISNAYFQGAFFPPPPQSPAMQHQGGPSFQVQGGSFGSWWPAELGHPSSAGSQNNLSYAIFPDKARLAVNLGGQVTVYDTGEHLIGGVGQQQSGDASWTFTSQFGTVYLNQLPVVSGAGAAPAPSAPSWESNPAPAPAADPAPMPAAEAGQGDVFAALEKLGSLRDAGILTDDEFATKKAELLSRL